jgi:hypothetical protein
MMPMRAEAARETIVRRDMLVSFLDATCRQLVDGG